MSTPSFKPSNGEFSTVRYFTDKDPYHYTVDNRPVGDVASNVGELVKATDAARRATILEAIGTSAINASTLGASEKTVGLHASVISGYTVSISRGVLITLQAMSEAVADEVVKIAALPSPSTATLSAPTTAGRETPYLIQIRYASYGSAPSVAYEDPLNIYLPSTMLNGKLEISVVQGAEADTGTSIAPTVVPGWIPLYLVVSAFGNAPVISDASGKPASVITSLRYVPVPSTSTSSGALGDAAITSSHLYLAVGTDSWKRVPLEAF